MKFFSALVVAALALTTSAAPTPVEESNLVARANRYHDRQQPKWLIQIHESHPDKAYGVSTNGRVHRVNGSKNINTLAQFVFDGKLKDHTCQFHFVDPSSVSGSQGIQVFTVGDDEDRITSADTWNDRPFRDQHVATISAKPGGSSTVETFGWGKTWDCPTEGTLEFELVPTGDNDDVRWVQPGGFAILSIPKW
ncbi:hypothetical protein DFH27DRAFT_117725 [Peziza echinospora]|nr:hypothetical protein DFH27DRAFT_117725 [Peziza echinospora]